MTMTNAAGDEFMTGRVAETVGLQSGKCEMKLLGNCRRLCH